MNGSGRFTSRTSAADPPPIARQKKLVAVVPNRLAVGTVKLRSRQPSDHWMGSVHCVLRLGPVGPLKNEGCSSPHRPSNAIHGNCARPCAGSLGMTATVAAHALARGAAQKEPHVEEVGV